MRVPDRKSEQTKSIATDAAISEAQTRDSRACTRVTALALAARWTFGGQV
jgi:hypothetical protein